MAKTMKQVHQEALEAVSAKIAEVGGDGYHAHELLTTIEALALLEDLLSPRETALDADPREGTLEAAIEEALAGTSDDDLVVLMVDADGGITIHSADSIEFDESIDAGKSPKQGPLS